MITNNLKAILSKKNISATRLAELTKINRNTINQIIHEKNKSIAMEHIDKICNILDINLNELFLYAPIKWFLFVEEITEEEQYTIFHINLSITIYNHEEARRSSITRNNDDNYLNKISESYPIGLLAKKRNDSNDFYVNFSHSIHYQRYQELLLNSDDGLDIYFQERIKELLAKACDDNSEPYLTGPEENNTSDLTIYFANSLDKVSKGAMSATDLFNIFNTMKVIDGEI